ncbi:hypothetical protein BH10PSE13_BH10PSE13_18930 [soil metagenome]
MSSGAGVGAFIDADPPYYAVIFTSIRTDEDGGYAEASDRMMELAAQQPGFLGVDSVRADLGITISYWRDEASITAWRRDAEHRLAQQGGRDRWYEAFTVRVARVERAYDFARHG